MQKSELIALRANKALSKAEGISMCNQQAVMASLAETVMPTQLSAVYLKWAEEGYSVMGDLVNDKNMIASIGEDE
jgi:hypothetical protein